MSPPLRTLTSARRLALLALLTLLAAGAWYLQYRGDSAPVATPPVEPPGVGSATAAPASGVTPWAADPTTAPAPTGAERTAAAPAHLPHADAPQGVRGRVVRPDGTPAAGATVFLMASARNRQIELYLLQQRGISEPPLASARTGDDGVFALGSTRPSVEHDLRIVDDGFAEPDGLTFTLREGTWVDLGEFRLQAGGVVQGRVLDERTHYGIAGAQVLLVDERKTMQPTPGRERGLATTTDRGGSFRFANAPLRGTVRLTAEAPGYASTTKPDLPLRSDAPLAVELLLAAGRPLAGVVVDTDGAAIASARVTAQSCDGPAAAAIATTERDGSFRFRDQREGAYRLQATADGFVTGELPAVAAGSTDARIVLVPRPSVRLRVLGAGGSDLPSYRIALLRHAPDTPLGVGKVPDFADRDITPADGAGSPWATIRGLPIGTFVFQVQARDHAQRLSEPFTIGDAGSAPVEVCVRLGLGGTLFGVVVDELDRPLAGATVATDADGSHQVQGGLPQLFGELVPKRHTTAAARTGADGTFRLPRLAFADYMLRVHHDDFCDGEASGLRLATEGEVKDVGRIRLARGAIVEGVATCGGLPLAQARVQLRIAAAGASIQAGTVPAAIGAAMTDADGGYRLPQRVPTGQYTIAVTRTTAEQDPFRMLLDLRESERRFEVRVGQGRAWIDLLLPNR